MSAKGWMIWQCVYAALFVACAVQACVSFAEGTAVFWAMIPAMAYSGCGLSCCNYFEQLEKQHGADRRADTEVHSDPDDGTVTVTFTSGGVTFVAGTVARTIGEARAEPRTVERAGIRLGEVEGYRAWRLCGPFLLSVASGTVWMPGQPCEGTGLSENNHAGVHAWKSIEDAKEYAEDEAPAVVGKVKLWGEIVEHELGYRGEYAKPVELIAAVLSDCSGESDELLAPIEPRVLAEVSRFYGLPNGRALED